MTGNQPDHSGTDHEDAAFLATLIGTESDIALEALRVRLADQAQRSGLLDVAYRTVDSPVGELLIAATDAGLLRVVFPAQGHDAALSTIADLVSPRVLKAPARLDPVARQLDEYFSGRRHVFELELDMRLAHGFRRVVLDHLLDIAYGTTASYATVASASGSPRAIRAVGTACARNPLPVVVPCHRVVRSDGTIGDYAGGSAAKQALLALEAA